MKKTLSFILVLMMMLSITACGEEKKVEKYDANIRSSVNANDNVDEPKAEGEEETKESAKDEIQEHEERLEAITATGAKDTNQRLAEATRYFDEVKSQIKTYDEYKVYVKQTITIPVNGNSMTTTADTEIQYSEKVLYSKTTADVEIEGSKVPTTYIIWIDMENNMEYVVTDMGVVKQPYEENTGMSKENAGMPEEFEIESVTVDNGVATIKGSISLENILKNTSNGDSTLENMEEEVKSSKVDVEILIDDETKLIKEFKMTSNNDKMKIDSVMTYDMSNVEMKEIPKEVKDAPSIEENLGDLLNGLNLNTNE